MTQRDTINALGRELLATLEPGDRSVTLHSDGSISVTATNGLVSHTSNGMTRCTWPVVTR